MNDNDNEFFYRSSPNSNPNEDAEYIVNFMIKLLNKQFRIRHKTSTQKRHTPSMDHLDDHDMYKKTHEGCICGKKKTT